MSELLRKAAERAIILKKRPHLRPPASTGVNVVGQHRTRQALRRYLREANPEQAHRWPELPDIEENGQLRLLTRRLLGMRHEFKSYDKTGEEERRDFLRAGIVGAGLTAAGGLAGLGLYKAGVSAAARNAAQLGGELNRAKKSLKGIRDWKLATATSAKATAATQKSAYEKAASKFYARDGAFDKHVNAVSRAQAAKAKAAAKTAKEQAAQAATASKQTANTTEIPEAIFKPTVAPKKARTYKTWALAKRALNNNEITQEEFDLMQFSVGRRDLSKMRYFNQLQTDEGGIPLTGRVPRDRFVKKIRDEDLDRRDANILRAGGAGALAGLMARGRIGAGKRALIGAGIGGLGVVGIRALTNNDRDIYGERNRGSKRAELIPAVGGLGAAAWLAGKRLKAFAKKFNHGGHRGHGVKEFNDPHRPDWAVHPSGGSLHVQSLVYKPQNYVPRWGMRRLLASKSDKVRSDAFDQAMRERERRRGLREAAMQNLSARLRGVKNFDDYRLYYFKGRNTGIAAKSVEEARSKKKRGGDELVAVRTPNATEKSQMARGVWVRTRRDGKSPDQSRYGKGRGQGPARKSMGARLAMKFFAEKRERREKRELNPYVGAALSGGVSGASLGALSWLKRGTSVASAGATAAKLGALSAGIVGGGALIGSRIVGDPRKEEGAPFTKRAALGGAITGALVGGAGGLLLRNTKFMKDAAKTWRPAKWMTEAPALGAGALGALGGAVIGGAQGADEGQQVDSIRNIRKDIRQKNFSLRLRARLKEFQVSPLNVESMAKTKERRSSERANFLKGIAAAAGLGLAGFGGYRLGRMVSKAERSAEIAAADMKIRAARFNAEGFRNTADAERKYYGGSSSSGSGSAKASSGSSSSGNAKASSSGNASSGSSSSGFDWEDLFRTGGRKKSYDDEYVRRSQQARQQSRPSGGSNPGASGSSQKGAQGVKNPYTGTDKAEAWEKWQSMDRMAKESPHEGERVAAAIARDKWKKRYNLARKLRGLKMFGRDDQPRYRDSKAWADPIMGWIRGDDLVDKDGNKWSPSSPQLVNAMHNKARGIRVNVQRGAGLAGDTTAVLQGKDRERDASGRVKKREWEKAWFRNAMTTAGLTVAGLAGAGAWRYGRMNPGTALGKFVTNTEQGVRKTKSDIKSGLGRIMGAADDATGPAKFIRKLLSAKLKLREFDLFASAAGWDTRDPRGRSVRVYAPGSRTRVRREKYWHEKADNQRKLMIAAGVGAAAIGGLGGVAAYRLAKGKSLVPSFMLKKPPQAAASKFQVSPEEMKSRTDAMAKMAKDEAAKRQAARVAAYEAQQKGKTPTKAYDAWRRKQAKTEPVPFPNAAA